MPLGDRGWSDRAENYVDGYTLNIAGSTATAIHKTDHKQPMVVTHITVCVNPSLGSGDVVLKDASATADSSDANRWQFYVASGASKGEFHAEFPRPIVFDTGIVVSATTVTGRISLGYKARHA